MSQVIKVNIADANVALFPDKIRTTGLGSCVGVVMYDPVMKSAGLIHVMLPSSSIAKQKAGLNRNKYADTGIPDLFQWMIRIGASPERIIAKMAGGAQMFQLKGKQEFLQIGKRNVEACKAILDKLNIKTVSEDVGGNMGRTIELDTATGRLKIHSLNQPLKEI
jgi:chemotaxis protein CheD